MAPKAPGNTENAAQNERLDDGLDTPSLASTNGPCVVYPAPASVGQTDPEGCWMKESHHAYPQLV